LYFGMVHTGSAIFGRCAVSLWTPRAAQVGGKTSSAKVLAGCGECAGPEVKIGQCGKRFKIVGVGAGRIYGGLAGVSRLVV